jgi:hypothetical protein
MRVRSEIRNNADLGLFLVIWTVRLVFPLLTGASVPQCGTKRKWLKTGE